MSDSKQKGFFVVWREGGGTPTYKHFDIEAAKREAERLTTAHGGDFHVLASVATATRRNIDWTQHEHDDGIRF